RITRSRQALALRDFRVRLGRQTVIDLSRGIGRHRGHLTLVGSRRQGFADLWGGFCFAVLRGSHGELASWTASDDAFWGGGFWHRVLFPSLWHGRSCGLMRLPSGSTSFEGVSFERPD